MLSIFGKTYPVIDAELHLPRVDEARWLYMGAYVEPDDGLRLWDIELASLQDLDDLDGKRIHVRPNGETYDDDTMGTDIVGMYDTTDMNGWKVGNEIYLYGDIQIDFERIEGRQFRCRFECTLTDKDEEPKNLPPEDFNIVGIADFIVVADERGRYG